MGIKRYLYCSICKKAFEAASGHERAGRITADPERIAAFLQDHVTHKPILLASDGPVIVEGDFEVVK